MGDFEKWRRLEEWVDRRARYTHDAIDDGGEMMLGLLEEYINMAQHAAEGWDSNLPLHYGEPLQTDLLFPVKYR